MKIVDFYNQGAQVQIEHPGVDMTHSFTASGSGEVEEIGYVPKPNSGRPQGAAHDIIEHDGKTMLALKGGHIYDVAIGADGDEDIKVHVISAEIDHVLLPLPSGAVVDVSEHDPSASTEPAPEETAEAQQGGSEDETASEGKLGDENAGDDAGTKE